jgi:hypothetical protein
MSPKSKSNSIQPARRRAASVVLVGEEGDNMTGNWIDQVSLRRDSRGRFTALAKKFCEDHMGQGRKRWIEIDRVADLKVPSQIATGLDRCAETIGVDLAWFEAVDELANLDWVVAAVVASQRGEDIPRLPALEVLVSQRSLRAFGRVQVSAEWGYDLHEVWLLMETWFRILGGEVVVVHAPYRYEGQACQAIWRFDVNAKEQLDIGIDDGGTGWAGDLDSITVLKGPNIEGVDIAKVALAASHNREKR